MEDGLYAMASSCHKASPPSKVSRTEIALFERHVATLDDVDGGVAILAAAVAGT